MEAYDGKLRDTDVMTTEQILRLIQSIPSKKAEPFKLWLAQVGKERIDEKSKKVEDLKIQFIDKSQNKVYNIFNLSKKLKARRK